MPVDLKRGCLTGLREWASTLGRDQRGLAFIEFAYSLPVFLALSLGGLELAHYVTTKMRVSQLALHVADHGARLGSGSLLAAKTINETQINDLFTGTGLQSSELDVYANGRVILSSLEPVAGSSPTRYKIAWQRCRGSKVHASSYGVAGDTNKPNMGPPGQEVTAPANGATMFVEIYYKYRPIIAGKFAPSLEFTEIASMTVRDRRDLTEIYNNENATKSLCT